MSRSTFPGTTAAELTTVLRPDLDAAEGCLRCQGWGAIAIPPESIIVCCPACQRSAPEATGLPRRRGRHIMGTERRELASHLRILYEGGATIWDLAQQYTRSHTFVRTLLVEAGTALRPSGRRPGTVRRA